MPAVAPEGLVDEVPLVDDDGDRLAVLDRLARDRLVLLGHAVHRVEDEEDDVGALHRVERPQPREVFDGRGELGRRLDARGVDQAEGMQLPVPALEFERELDRVPGRARHVCSRSAGRCSSRRLASEDLPTLGRPMKLMQIGPGRSASGRLLARLRSGPARAAPGSPRAARPRRARARRRRRSARPGRAGPRPRRSTFSSPKSALLTTRITGLPPAAQARGDPVVERGDAAPGRR